MGELNIDGETGTHLLTIDGSGDTVADNNVVITNESISGLAPAVINYDATGGDFASEFDSNSGTFAPGITISAGSGGNTIDIDSTRNNATLVEVTQVNSGNGNDSVQIAPTLQKYLVVDGEDGNDSIDARATSVGVTLFGGDGRDLIHGGAGDDILVGGLGDDNDSDADIQVIDGGIFGQDGNDVLVGDDAIVQRDSQYVVQRIETANEGLGGSDELFGEKGDDVLIGGAGGDHLTSDVADSSAPIGTDIILGDNGVVVRNDGSSEANDVFTRNDAAGGIDTIIGGDGDNILIGGALGDFITGGAGNEIIIGDGGTVQRDENDQVERAETAITTTGGADTIDGGAGADVIFGGADGDTITANTGGKIIVGDNGVVIAGGDVYTTNPNIGGTDNITGSLAEQRNIILGGVGSRTVTLSDNTQIEVGDTIVGGNGDDILIGDGGYVTRSGNLVTHVSTTGKQETEDENGEFGGNDVISSADGDDLIIGGAGNDMIDAPDGNNTILGDNGVINLNSALSNNIFTTSPSIGGKDTITGGDGENIIIGGAEGDNITGGVGDETILGDGGTLYRDGDEKVTRVETGDIEDPTGEFGGVDVIDGGAGTDVILGGAKGDQITANVGGKIILGDNGVVITGGDVYTTNPSVGGADTIMGGEDGERNIILGGGGSRNEMLPDGTQVEVGDTIMGGTGNDILIGDGGYVSRTGDVVTKVATTGRTETGDVTGSIGGNDDISSTGGMDIILGGAGNDTISVPAGNNIVLGDNGIVNLTSNDQDIYSTEPSVGGSDKITGGTGTNIILGGAKGDEIDGGLGAEIILGDGGYITRNASAKVTQIRSWDTAIGGNDDIEGNGARDIILGGAEGDSIDGNDGDDIILGDSGKLDFSTPGDLTTIGLVESIDESVGGSDTVRGNAGNDIIVGGANDLDVESLSGDTGNDIIIGDSGKLEYLIDGNVSSLDRISNSAIGTGGGDEVHGDQNDDIILGGDGMDTITADSGNDIILGDQGEIHLSLNGVVTRVASVNPNDGTGDDISAGDGNDFVIGGTGSDDIDAGAGNDQVFGDHGLLVGDVDPATIATAGSQFTYTSIFRNNSDGGTGDQIQGGPGADVILGQQGADEILAGPGNDDIYGGHNVSGGQDGDDRLDGQAGDDVIVGDNAIISRRGDTIDPAVRTLQSNTIYGETVMADDGLPLIDGMAQADPEGVESRTIEILDHASSGIGAEVFGADYIAGGADDDVIFGQLGDDTIQGDGSINLTVSAERTMAGTLSISASVENVATDGDDYIEGNGGSDTVFGNLGQDDIIGGSSDLFAGLLNPANRPDGSDLLFGGAGTDLARNNPGDTTSDGHARDADVIAGDNANIYRLVNTTNGEFLSFNYDDSSFGYSADLKIIPRAVDLLDYTPGGMDFDASAANDIGDADEIHGESGDDVIYAQVGDDIVFGEGQNDDIIGGWGPDWISGGTGTDGVIGDDGRIYTSRNHPTIGEPLYGIDAASAESLSTPGSVLESTINVEGELKKTVNLTPFNVDLSSFQDPDFAAMFADDIIFGGLGDDFLHGGSGDDGISGAEALADSAIEIAPPNASPIVVSSGYDVPTNLGRMLGFGIDPSRPEEFYLYDEFEPRLRIEFGTQQFLLNNDASEADGEDRIFGDLGNDWLVGGTGQDHIFGGYGNDLINVDDDLSTNGGLNDVQDAAVSENYDIAYGGAGRDVMIANVEGDRLVDWAGNFNSYIAPNGHGTVNSSLSPQIAEFLIALSASDGADPTRAADTGNLPLERRGEPDGELGLVRQHDDDWHDQTGGPDDPNVGGIPSGPREKLKGADFNNGQPQGFFIDSGDWIASGGRMEVSPSVEDGDAASVFHIEDALPSYFEVEATINGGKPTSGLKSNAFIIFDYQHEYDFKYAGVNISTDKIEIGYRDATGWHELDQANSQLKPDRDYEVLLSVNGVVATLVVDNQDYFSYTFSPRIDVDGYAWGLNAGMVGLGAQDSIARIDDVEVKILPPEVTFEDEEDLEDGTADLYAAGSAGQWNVVESAGNHRFDGAPDAGEELAYSHAFLTIAPSSILVLEATFKTDSIGGFIFDQSSPDRFKFAGIDAATGNVVIGHHTAKRGYVIDATVHLGIVAGQDYTVELTLKGTTVSVVLDGQIVLGHAFNAVTVDGSFGLMTRGGTTSFDDVHVSTDDPAYESDPVAAVAADNQALPGNAKDVNADGEITSFDALLVINHLNSPVVQKSLNKDHDKNRLDVNLDGLVSSLDALLVINWLNMEQTAAANNLIESQEQPFDANPAIPDPTINGAIADRAIEEISDDDEISAINVVSPELVLMETRSEKPQSIAAQDNCNDLHRMRALCDVNEELETKDTEAMEAFVDEPLWKERT